MSNGETLIVADEREVEELERNRRAIARALAREDPVMQMDLIRAWAAEGAQAPGGVARIAAWRLEDRLSAYFEAHPEAMERLVRREVEAVVRALVAMARSSRALNPTQAGSLRKARHDREGSTAMPDGTTKGATALVLRDGDGTLYILDEQAIRACRAGPEQQAMLSESLPDQEDVSGFLFMNVAGLSGQLFFVTQAETRETGARGHDNFVGPVTATGIFTATIGPVGSGLRP